VGVAVEGVGVQLYTPQRGVRVWVQGGEGSAR